MAPRDEPPPSRWNSSSILYGFIISLYVAGAIILFIYIFTRGQRRQKKREILEKHKMLQAEMLLVEQQKLLLKEKQKLLEVTQNVKILEDKNDSDPIEVVEDTCNYKIKETVFENPTEDDIKCLTRDPKTSIEKKKD